MNICKLVNITGTYNVKFAIHIPYSDTINRLQINYFEQWDVLSTVVYFDSTFIPLIDDTHWNNFSIAVVQQELDKANFPSIEYTFNNTSGALAGNTFLDDMNNPIPANVSISYNGLYINSTNISKVGFNFNYLDTTKIYDITATPTSGDYNGKVIRVQPVLDVLSYKFIVFANYDSIIEHEYTFKLQVADSLGDLLFNLDSSYTNISIDQTGTITIGYVVGVYKFTANVSDNKLKLTKQLDIEIEVI